MLRTKTKITYQDYTALPDDQRFELIDGQLLMTPSPATAHQRIIRNLSYLLSEYVDKNKLGEVFFAPYDVVLSEFDVVQPDILFVSGSHAGIIGDKNIQGTPDLVIEIVSPTHKERGQFVKKDLYARFGVMEYWIVDSQRKWIEVLKLIDHRYDLAGIFLESDVLISPILPGLELNVDRVFRNV